MKKITLSTILCLSGILLLTGCDSFLDVEPDSRTKIDQPKKVKDLLVNGYPTVGTMPLFEHRTDNYQDNGFNYSSGSPFIQKNYFWQGVDDNINESSEQLWQNCYGCISVANLALKSIEEMGTPDELLPYKAEALLLRAYNHFVLANAFCLPYSPSTAANHLGVHYMKELESKIGQHYDRGTLAQTYAEIEKDILEALPLVDDEVFQVPAYHFNSRAANSFAAKFFLYSEKWQKAVKYADLALGRNPENYLYDYAGITAKIGSDLASWPVVYSSYEDPANFLITPITTGFLVEIFNAPRYGHADAIASEQTTNGPGPWSTAAQTALPVFAPIMLGNSQNIYLVKYYPMIEWLDRLAGTGYYHTGYIPFNGDETLLYRAEANVMLKNYDTATKDLGMWYKAFGAPNIDYSTKLITDFYQARVTKNSPVTKPLNPAFTIEAGTQTLLMHAVLHARRIETLESGQRWEDIRRYGIEITHNVVNGVPMTLTKDDPRRVLPIPLINEAAGVEPNPTK